MVMRVTTLIALPSGIGLAVLAKPIMRMIYSDAPAAVEMSGPQLQVLGFAVVFICLSAPINSILQALGRADIPAKIVLVGGAVKLVLNIVLVSNPYINIMGSAYSTLACYVVMVLLSLHALRKTVGASLNWRSMFVRPLLATGGCALAAWGVNALFSLAIPATAATVSAIVAAVVVYAALLFLLRAIRAEDVRMLPGGQKIAKLLAKWRWIG